MNRIKITPELAKSFSEKRAASMEPEFKMCGNGEVTYGCKVIEKTSAAVFVLVHSYLTCFGFWMPANVYEMVKDGVLITRGISINYNNTIYVY